MFRFGKGYQSAYTWISMNLFWFCNISSLIVTFFGFEQSFTNQRTSLFCLHFQANIDSLTFLDKEDDSHFLENHFKMINAKSSKSYLFLYDLKNFGSQQFTTLTWLSHQMCSSFISKLQIFRFSCFWNEFTALVSWQIFNTQKPVCLQQIHIQK